MVCGLGGSVLTTLLTLAMVTGPNSGKRLVYRDYQPVVMVHRTVRQFCRSAGGRPQQSQANSLKGVKRPRSLAACAPRAMMRRPITCPSLNCGKATLSWSKRAILFPAMARSSKAAPRWMKVRFTGESAPVIRESGGDFASVTGGTRILSDWLVIACSVQFWRNLS
ncbi:potassium-transporting ATPase subunit B [Salmonella enterica subsp. enterica serovar Sanjuan]|uniref:Potassium-transporting ATPase subunit B n=1 Tax=Salmonella enterica subsp. enterica serovar Sanjuan TaxID=1160765 RepID=A0A3S4IY78_SALET|nr:potassium-transporting ATPase subunit B [Salmonella enterica subsp. enterica serovar Sanjuan]